MLPQKRISEILVIGAALLCFGWTLFFDFAYDDFHRIHKHGLVTSSEISASTLLFPFFEPTQPDNLFRPLTTLSFRLNYIVGGLNPIGYHLVNILLHAFCAWLVFVLAQCLLRSNPVALFAALWFAVHPIHVEAVANISGRAELLSAAFGLLAVWVFRLASTEDDRPRRAYLYVASVFSFGLALLSKESALTLLPLIPLYSLVTVETGPANRRKLNRRALRGFFVLLAGAAACLLYRKVILQDLFIPPRDLVTYYAENPLLQENFFVRLIPGLKIFGDYLKLLILPIHLSIDYSLNQNDFWHSVYSWPAVVSLVVVAVFAGVVWYFRKFRFAFFGVWTLAAFSLTLNILLPIGTIMGERLAYLPSVGFIIFATGVGAWAVKEKSLALLGSRGALALIVLAYGTLSVLRLPAWRDNAAVFTQAVADNPRSPKAQENLGLYLYHDQKNYSAAEAAFRDTIALDPGRLNAYKHLVNIYLFSNDYPRAEFWARKALIIEPDDAEVLQALEQLLNLKDEMKDLLQDPTRSQAEGR